MAGQGKGISDAVRGAVREWLTDQTVQVLYDEYIEANKAKGINTGVVSFGYLIRKASEWVRIVRRRGAKGWVREYYSKNFPKRNVVLEVNSNEADTHIEYVTVKVNGKILGGGKVRVPSVLVSQVGRKANLNLDLVFTPFSETELLALQAEMEHGEAAVHALLFDERVI